MSSNDARPTSSKDASSKTASDGGNGDGAQAEVRVSGMQRVVEFFALRQSMVGLLVMVILIGMGEKLAERFLPLYLLALAPGFLFLPGLLNGMDTLLSALYSYPGGYLSDHLGVKKALLVFNLLAMFGFAIVVLIPSWPAVFIGSFFFLSWTAISLPATMDLVSTVLPKNKRTMGVSVHSLVRRIPMAIGPIVGGLLIDHYRREYIAQYGPEEGADMGVMMGVRVAFLLALILAGVAAVAQQILIEEPRKAGTSKKVAESNPMVLWRLMSPSLKSLLVSDILVRFCEQIPYAYLAIWAMQSAGGARISATEFGVLTTIEMIVAILIYIPVAYLADKGSKKPFVVATFVFFTIFPLILLASQTFWLLVVAFIVRGLKEFGEPTRKALIMDLAPEDRKAGMFGLYYLLRDMVVSISAFGGAFLWAYGGPEVTLITAFVFGVIGTAWFAIYGKDLSSEQEGRPDVA
jgi:MFS family permease